jgi:hypothetical protein
MWRAAERGPRETLDATIMVARILQLSSLPHVNICFNLIPDHVGSNGGPLDVPVLCRSLGEHHP